MNRCSTRRGNGSRKKATGRPEWFYQMRKKKKSAKQTLGSRKATRETNRLKESSRKATRKSDQQNENSSESAAEIDVLSPTGDTRTQYHYNEKLRATGMEKRGSEIWRLLKSSMILEKRITSLKIFKNCFYSAKDVIATNPSSTPRHRHTGGGQLVPKGIQRKLYNVGSEQYQSYIA